MTNLPAALIISGRFVIRFSSFVIYLPLSLRRGVWIPGFSKKNSDAPPHCDLGFE